MMYRRRQFVLSCGQFASKMLFLWQIKASGGNPFSLLAKQDFGLAGPSCVLTLFRRSPPFAERPNEVLDKGHPLTGI